MQALKYLAQAINSKDKFFGIAGNKDKRALTLQRVTTFASLRDNLIRRANWLNQKGIKLGSFEYTDTSMDLGDHGGNLFKIILRNVDASVDIEPVVHEIRQKGFINYFGLQRFGQSMSNSTQLIGKCMLKQDYEGAVKLILGPRQEKNKVVAAAREAYAENGDVEEALKKFPRFMVLERKVLLGMAKAGGDKAYWNGIVELPRNSRMLYGHAYQSYIWNRAVSYRASLGLELQPGDFVSRNTQDITVITPENINDFTIEDLALPLPGCMIDYPENLKSLYESLLAEDGLTSESFVADVKSLSLTGAYRRCLVIPKDLELRELKYADMNDEEPSESGDIRGIEISFTLPSSSYATMLLRELMKQ